MMDILSTTNYDQFHRIPGNRPVLEGRVKAMMYSLQRNNFLQDRPIEVSREYGIAEGQHRLEAAKRLGLPIYYFIVDLNDAEALGRAFQGNGTQWATTTPNFLDRWATAGKNDYIILKEFCVNYELAIGIGLKLLSGYSVLGGGSAGVRVDQGGRFSPGTLLQLFKDGQFQIVNGAKQDAEILAGRLVELKQYSEGTVWKDQNFIGALQKLYKKYPHPKFVQKLRTHGFTIRREGSVKSYLLQLENFINFGARNKVALYSVGD